MNISMDGIFETVFMLGFLLLVCGLLIFKVIPFVKAEKNYEEAKRKKVLLVVRIAVIFQIIAFFIGVIVIFIVLMARYVQSG